MLKDVPDGEVLLIKAFKKPAGSDLTILWHLPMNDFFSCSWEVLDVTVNALLSHRLMILFPDEAERRGRGFYPGIVFYTV